MYRVSRKLLGYWTLSICLLSASLSYGQTPTPTESRGQPKKQTTEEKKKPAPDKRGTDELPLVTKVIPADNSQKEPKELSQEEKDHAPDYGWISDLLLALFTGGLFLATWLLWRATEKLVRGSEKTAERQLRAYIAVKEDEHEPIRDISLPDNPDTHFLDIHMSLKNVGQTPAFKLSQWTKAHVGSYVTQLPSFEPIPSQGIYVPPGMEMSFVTRIDTPWTRQMIEMDMGDDMCLHVWGEIHYVDIFDTRRFLKFRFVKRHGDTGKALECYPEGNEAN